MRSRLAIRAALILTVTWIAGCGEKNKWLQEFVQGFSGPPKEMDWLDDPDPDKRREAIEVLSFQRRFLREPYTEYYALALRQDQDALVRGAAARALGKAADPQYVPPLVEALDDASPIVRRDAAWALDRLPDEAAVAPLQARAVGDPSRDVRIACLRALAHYPISQVGQTLIRCLEDADLGVRRQARASLAELTGVDVGDQPEDWRAYLGDETAGGQ